MSDLDHARSLLRMAQSDLNALRGMMTGESSSGTAFFSDEVFGIHAQQAAEKCLKAWIASLGKRYPRTHDLMSLLEELTAAGEDTTSLEELVELTPFAVEYRYELLDPDDDLLNRGEFLERVQTVFERISLIICPGESTG
jgi:HEPN domain-containing protein